MSTCSHGCTGGRSAIKSETHISNSAATDAQHLDHMALTAATSQGSFSRSIGFPSRMGKATAEIKGKVPECVKDDFEALAHSLGMSSSDLVRRIVMVRLYGIEGTQRMLLHQLHAAAGIGPESAANETEGA